MNSEKDTLGKGRCKCLFRHERDDLVEGLVTLLDKKRMENIRENLKEQRLETDPSFESMQKITLNTLERVRNTPLCVEEYKD